MKSVDTKSYELAEHFLADEPAERRTPENTQDLAEAIQQAIEDWFSGQETLAAVEGAGV
jgi:hypothetical protein